MTSRVHAVSATGIRGDEILALAEPEDDRGPRARRDEDSGLVARRDDDGVGSRQPRRGLAHGLEEVAAEGLLHFVREDFGVGLAREAMPPRRQDGLALGEVLEDAVVDDDDLAVAVPVRVRVDLRRAARGSPSACARFPSCPRSERRPRSSRMRFESLPGDCARRRSGRSRASRCRPSRSPGTRGASIPRSGWAPPGFGPT